jgi:hypothetical protein
VSDDDGTVSSTHVPTVRCVWVPVTLSYHTRHSMLLSPEDQALVALSVLKGPKCGS